MRRFLVIPAAAVAACIATTLAVGSASAAGGAGIIRPWGIQNEEGDVDVPRAEALDDARANDILVAHAQAYKGDVSAMRSVNPKLRIFAYVNAMFARTRDGDRYPSGWYARDVNGDRIRNRKTGNWLMLPTSDGWIETRIAECKTRVRDGGYQGCSLDMLGLASTSLGFVTGKPVNPNTGKEFTREGWIEWTAHVAQIIERNAGVPVIGNGLSKGFLYYKENTRQLLTVMDGGIAEAWLRGSKKPVDSYPTHTNWKRDVNMIRDAEAQGKPLLTLTKLWVPATKGQRKAWRRFALASFLLGANGKSHFFFSAKFSADRTRAHRWYGTRLGKPKARYRRRHEVYVRNFTKGKVLVNPSNEARRYPLQRLFLNLDGSRVSGSVTLEPHGARILRLAD